MSTARKINKRLQLQNANAREKRREFRNMRFAVFTNIKLRGRRGYIGFPFRLGRPSTHEARGLYAAHQGKREIARRSRQHFPFEQYADVCGIGNRFLRNVGNADFGVAA